MENEWLTEKSSFLYGIHRVNYFLGKSMLLTSDLVITDILNYNYFKHYKYFYCDYILSAIVMKIEAWGISIISGPNNRSKTISINTKRLSTVYSVHERETSPEPRDKLQVGSVSIMNFRALCIQGSHAACQAVHLSALISFAS